MQNRPLPTQGSSPRMRGTRSINNAAQHFYGIIPAYAGNTDQLASWSDAPRDHPRVCGEHLCRSCRSTLLRGSSPRMRGTLGQGAGGGDVRGIIPAYAGNTNHLLERWRVHRDHPRVCGEHRGERRFLGECRGSSPRMRGTLSGNIEEVGERGIIPAYAGNTPRHGSSPACRRDHPRVCGEHTALHQRCAGPLGSSPRMRGTLLRWSVVFRDVGIIPAYAGNTLLIML